jgi:hypothetical protein
VVHGQGAHRSTTRRNGRAGFPALAAAWLLVLAAGAAAAAPPPAPPLDLEAFYGAGRVSTRARVPEGAAAASQRRQVADSLRQGLRSEIVFQLRVYAPGRGLAALLGDELLAETSIARTVRYDPFARWYVVEESTDSGPPERTTGTDGDRLLLGLFAVSHEGPLSLRSPLPPGSYVAARYRFSPIRVDGMLRIVSLFFDVGSRTSAWARRPLEASP